MDSEFKKTARAFRTTLPSYGEDEGSTEDPKVHVVCLTYPPNPGTRSKLKYLRRYRSFIHEARIVCSDALSSAKDLYDSLIPRGCVVQFLHVEYSVDTEYSTVNMSSLRGLVSSVHIKIQTIREDDVFRAVSTVRKSDDFGIRISGWHAFTPQYVEFVRDSFGDSSGNFLYEVSRGYLVFWAEEKYPQSVEAQSVKAQSVENSTLGRYDPVDSSSPSKTSREAENPSDST